MTSSVGKRILLLLGNNTFPRNPPVRTAVLALIDAGYQVTMLCPRGPAQSWYEEYRGVEIYRYPALPACNVFVICGLAYGYSVVAVFALSLWVLWQHGFDVIHTHNPPDFLVRIATLYQYWGKEFANTHPDLALTINDLLTDSGITHKTDAHRTPAQLIAVTERTR